MLQAHLATLRLLFEEYADEHATERGMRHRFGLEEALKLMHNAQISGHHLSIREVRHAYFKSRMVVANEIMDWEKFTSLSFVEYLEFLARCADAMPIPTAEEMGEAGHVNCLLDFFAAHRATHTGSDAAHHYARRPSAGAAPRWASWETM